MDSDSRGRKGRRARPDRTLTFQMKISETLKEILDSEKLPTERYNDCIIRLLKERTQKIAELNKEIEELRYRLTIPGIIQKGE